MGEGAIKPYFKTVVVIPVGPAEPVDGVADTLESIRHFFSASHKIVIVDNSRAGKGAQLRARFPEIDVVPGQYSGKFAKLFLNISLGTAHAYEQFKFDVLLRMDADALITGPHPDDDAIGYFRAHPAAGQIGVYRTDYDGKPLRWWPVNVMMLAQGLNPLSWLWPRYAGWHFRKQFVRALRRGYKVGEHIYGGAFFLSWECVGRLHRSGVLRNPLLADLRLAEDHITSVAVVASGLDLGDFASQGPCAEAWLGLPAAPEELLRRGKKVIHSLHGYAGRREPELRAFFAGRRAQG